MSENESHAEPKGAQWTLDELDNLLDPKTDVEKKAMGDVGPQSAPTKYNVHDLSALERFVEETERGLEVPKEITFH
jgi:hypothetical protein